MPILLLRERLIYRGLRVADFNTFREVIPLYVRNCVASLPDTFSWSSPVFRFQSEMLKIYSKQIQLRYFSAEKFGE